MNDKNLNPVAEKTMVLLLQNPNMVDGYLQLLQKEVEDARAALERAEADLSAARNIIQLARPRPAVAAAAESVALTDSASARRQVNVAVVERATLTDRADAVVTQGDNYNRRARILDAANSLAGGSELVTVADVLRRLEVEGYEIGGDRPGTSVGNILMKAPGWIRVAEGTFKRQEKQFPMS